MPTTNSTMPSSSRKMLVSTTGGGAGVPAQRLMLDATNVAPAREIAPSPIDAIRSPRRSRGSAPRA
jgi:hypothetical protein